MRWPSSPVVSAVRHLIPSSLKAPLWNILSRHLPLRDSFDQADVSAQEFEIMERVRAFTMTGDTRILSLIRAVDYLCAHELEGAIVECGVFRGGSMMAAALALQRNGDSRRDLYLYDTFEGMVRPEDRDVDLTGRPAMIDFRSHQISEQQSTWAAAGLAEVQRNMQSTDYPGQHIHYVQGRVEETLPAILPNSIALLRLDTDWYASTRHELEQLFPLLVKGGVLIVDDYGHYKGCKEAVDEYFAGQPGPLLLTRVDYSARLLVKHW